MATEIKTLCTRHYYQYLEDYGDDGMAVLNDDSTCHDCERHATDCICADCSGAELTADND